MALQAGSERITTYADRSLRPRMTAKYSGRTSKEKHIRAGHKASTTKLLSKLDELRVDSDSVDTSKLLKLKLSLEEKLDTLKT